MEEIQNFRPTKALINLKAIEMNVKNLRQHLQSDVDIIAVVKANAYGHGDVEVAKVALCAGATMLAVATPEEALHIRQHLVEVPILVLGVVPVRFAPVAAKHHITLTVFSIDWLQKAATLLDAKTLLVHLKVDSGMGRIGVRSEKELLEVYNFITQCEQIQLDGIFTHFATADEEKDTYYEKQLTMFKSCVNTLPEKPRLVHAANTAASLLKDRIQFDAVRFGISLYGLAPSTFVEKHLPFPLQPAMSLKTELVHVKQLRKGETVGYGGTYAAKQDGEWIGTLPIGYADGMLRQLGGQEVLIDGQRMPLVGRICMDQCMVRLSKAYNVGQEVVLIGKQGKQEIPMQEWATKVQTIVYEIPCILTSRIPRIYER